MKVFGYARISGIDQNESRQLIAMQEYNIPHEQIFVDKQSGKDFQRPEYQKLVKQLKSGDLLYIKSIDRLGRNYEEIQNQWRLLTKEKGVDIAVIDMALLDTRLHKDLIGTFISDLVLQVLSFMAAQELQTIRERQAEGIAAAKARGVRFGRPEKNLPDDFGALIKQWERRQINTEDILKLSGFCRSTFYSKLKEYKLLQKQ
jgi:DNA invertase Pin-like site-specific DNA recombinase